MHHSKAEKEKAEAKADAIEAKAEARAEAKEAKAHAAEAEVKAKKAPPKVGDKVKYKPDGLPDHEWAGVITKINEDGTVDLVVEAKNMEGKKESKTAVHVLKDEYKEGEEKPAERYCTL